MKKRLIFILLLIIIIMSFTKVNANSIIKFDIESDKQKVKENDELIVNIGTAEYTDMEDEINTYKAKIDYDKSIFEEIDENNFYCLNSWTDFKYNKENGQLITIKKEGSKEAEDILQIHFKVKTDANLGDTIIKIKDITTSYGESDISSEQLELKINVYKTEQSENISADNKNNTNAENNELEQNNENESKIQEIEKENLINNIIEEENISDKILPNTGKSNIIVYAIIIMIAIEIVIYIKNKKINRNILAMIILLIISISIKQIYTFANSTEAGDINKDGQIDYLDVNILEEILIELKTIEYSNIADMNNNKIINLTDLSLLVKYVYNDKEEKEITVSDTSFPGYTFEQITPQNNNVTYDRILMANKAMTEYGITGAGSQWPVGLESSNEGSLMLYGIDVAGMYKSTDHGKTWVTANSGIVSRGVEMFAIDPHNTNHVLALGSSLKDSIGGMHVSYNMAETWKKTQNFSTYGYRYLWDGLEFDPTSYDSQTGYSMDVYFSIPYKRDTDIRVDPQVEVETKSQLKENEVGLYKSSDGGETFTLIINDAKLADGIVKITDNGEIYIGNQYGLFLINKETYEIKETYLQNDPSVDYSKGITGLDVVGNTIYAQTWDGIYTLINGELTKITNENYRSSRWPQFVEVSKSNPNHIVIQYRRNVKSYYVNDTSVSFDGGKTWQTAIANNNTTFYKSSWLSREKTYIIDPSDDNNVITFGADTLMRSSDGGKNFIQVSGISNLMQGGRFNFNYYDNNLLFFSAQDYTGVISTDGGETYSRINILGKGNLYGGFAVDENTIYGFANKSWYGGTLTYTHDGGDTWVDTGLSVSGVSETTYYSSLQSITNPNVLFAAEYYSKDKGYTWNKMNGCTSVFTFNYEGKKELYGGNESGNLVVSYDNGDTWTELSTGHWNTDSNIAREYIIDLAYDQVNNNMYTLIQATYTWRFKVNIFI
ncbi:MAG: hypothetical protein IJE05_06215 [Clostridia bacterium]|nr:hypothetical protein [Clostridia bacterium]